MDGVLSRRLALAPYKRITNISAKQSFFERLLGLVTLNVDTAGGDMSEVVFRRITKSDAQAAEVFLRKIIDGQRPDGSNAH
jgi:putative membrane protein